VAVVGVWDWLLQLAQQAAPSHEVWQTVKGRAKHCLPFFGVDGVS